MFCQEPVEGLKVARTYAPVPGAEFTPRPHSFALVADRVRNLLVQVPDEGAHAPQHVRDNEGSARALALVAGGGEEGGCECGGGERNEPFSALDVRRPT